MHVDQAVDSGLCLGGVILTIWKLMVAWQKGIKLKKKTPQLAGVKGQGWLRWFGRLRLEKRLEGSQSLEGESLKADPREYQQHCPLDIHFDKTHRPREQIEFAIVIFAITLHGLFLIIYTLFLQIQKIKIEVIILY